jgi:cytochrome c biogenesis protein CcmG/thiol:disulfide interchange protein DsbE
MKKLFLIPLALFVVLAVFLGIGLNRDPHVVPSPLVGKAAPAFNLPQLESDASFSPQQMAGKVWLLNVWATWCAPCREEHPVLVEFAKAQLAPMVGLDYKDKPADAKAWLARYGNPYEFTVVDADGRVGIDYGVYGVPETYVIDKAGIIRFKQIGPVTRELMRDKIVPLVKELQK